MGQIWAPGLEGPTERHWTRTWVIELLIGETEKKRRQKPQSRHGLLIQIKKHGLNQKWNALLLRTRVQKIIYELFCDWRISSKSQKRRATRRRKRRKRRKRRGSKGEEAHWTF